MLRLNVLFHFFCTVHFIILFLPYHVAALNTPGYVF